MNSSEKTDIRPIIIAIDGHSSSGKSSMAKSLARRIGYRYIDSGAMYRAVTLYAIRHGLADISAGTVDSKALIQALPDISIDFRPTPAGQRTLLGGEDVEDRIRTMEVSSLVSPVAAIPEVRHALVAMQQEFGKGKGIVMDGRDIGTTVFPDAEMKVYVTASPETRARRRFLELQAKGDSTVSFDDVLSNVRHRDHIDSTRAESPLRKAPDALVLDNSDMTVEQQDRWLMDQFKRITSH